MAKKKRSERKKKQASTKTPVARPSVAATNTGRPLENGDVKSLTEPIGRTEEIERAASADSVRSKFSLRMPGAFCIDEGTLEKISRLLADFGSVTVKAECSDDVARRFEGLDSLLNYENAAGHRITSLKLGADANFEASACVDFEDKWWFGGISVNLAGPDEEVSRLRTKLLDVISGARSWYGPFANFDFYLAAFVIYTVFWLGLLIGVATRWLPSSEQSNPSTRGSAIAQLFVVGMIGVLFGLSYVMSRFRTILFPRMSFLIGQGKTRYETLEKWRWGAVIAFGASVAAGIVILCFQIAFT